MKKTGTLLKDKSIRIRHFSYQYPNRKNPDWVYINMVLEGESEYGKSYLKHQAAEYGPGLVVHDVEKYEEALLGMGINFDVECDERGFSPLEFTYTKGDPDEFSTREKNIAKDCSITELDSFPGIYRYQEYCLNNLVVQGAIQQIKMLNDFGTSKDTHFVEMSTFQTTLETLHANWH